MEKQIDHIEARGSKFCARRTFWSYPMMHADADVLLDQCPMTGAGGIKCSMKKKAAELRCSFRKNPIPITTFVAELIPRLRPCLQCSRVQERGFRQISSLRSS